MEGWAPCRGREGGAVGGGLRPGMGRSAGVGVCGIVRCCRMRPAERRWCGGWGRCGVPWCAWGARRRAEAACRPAGGPLALLVRVLLLPPLLAVLRLAARQHLLDWQVETLVRWALPLRASGDLAARLGHLTPWRRGRRGEGLRRLH